jgi:5-formyltetrahydrofolate cyclo-ligase
VGYGKGYYDKFLARCHPNVIKTGLSFYDAVDKIDDIEAFDIPLDFCVTPQKIYNF